MTVVIGYDGSPEADRAVRAAGDLLGGRSALVVVVWKAGLGFDLVALPTTGIGLPPGPLDIRTAMEVDELQMEAAQRMAEHGAALAREAGLAAESLTVADDPETEIAETLAQVVKERDGEALVVGAKVHSGLLGATTRGAIKRAPCAVLVRGPTG
jgi:nucleotide-binding universal stress UspA family protein